METYPAATAFNMRLGSLIKDVCQNANRMAIVCEYKLIERLSYMSYKIQYVDNNETVNLNQSNDTIFNMYINGYTKTKNSFNCF